jgi:hypothetical protein
MVGLHSLSNELLAHVFSSCPTIGSAMALSKADKKLHAIWVMYNDQIAASVLPQQLPDYEDALDLAILEQVWPNENTQVASPPFSKTTTQLLHNAILATDATDTWAWAACKRATDRTAPFAHGMFYLENPAAYGAYYHMRKIALSYLYPEARLQNAICATLRSYARTDGDRLQRFHTILTCNEVALRDRAKHGLDKPVREWAQWECEMWHELGSPMHIVSDHWQYVGRVIHALVKDDTTEGNKLEMVLGVRTTVSDTVAT